MRGGPPKEAMADVDRMLSPRWRSCCRGGLCVSSRKGDGHDPYNLRVVPAAAVRTGRYKDQHYTMSEAGVTAFRKVDRWRTDTQFTPLVAWRRECALYKSVSSLPFFRDYSKWRTYRLWKHELNAVKRNECARQLNERAFILDDHFGKALRSIAAKCDNLRTLRMHELQPSVEGASLAAIADGQHRHLRAFAKRLDAFRDGVVSDVLAACLAASTQLEEKLDATSAAELIGDAEAYTASPPTQQQQQQRRGAPAVTASGSRGRSAEDEAAEAAEAVAAVRSAAAGSDRRPDPRSCSCARRRRRGRCQSRRGARSRRLLCGGLSECGGPRHRRGSGRDAARPRPVHGRQRRRHQHEAVGQPPLLPAASAASALRALGALRPLRAVRAALNVAPAAPDVARRSTRDVLVNGRLPSPPPLLPPRWRPQHRPAARTGRRRRRTPTSRRCRLSRTAARPCATHRSVAAPD